MKRWSVLISLVTAGCASTTGVFPIDYQFIDIPQEHRIELKYHNDSQRSVCLFPEAWPNSAGKIKQASKVMFLVIDGERFPVADFDTGYCPEGCATPVAPGEEVTASIPYGDFGVPDRLVGKEKKLEFAPVAFFCRR
jgi:hypothetical protein